MSYVSASIGNYFSQHCRSCAHTIELHYGTADRWCNRNGCSCQKYVGDGFGDIDRDVIPNEKKSQKSNHFLSQFQRVGDVE